ncbi:hypothetical protein DFAR_30010 [Desulfarculales bacterium]
MVLERLAQRQTSGGSSSDGRPEFLDRQAATWEGSFQLLAEHSLVVDGGILLDENLG